MTTPPLLSQVCARGMEIVKETPPSFDEAKRFESMCKLLAREFPLVKEKRIQAIISGYNEIRGLI